MRIKVRLHPGSSQEKIVKVCDKEYEVWLMEKPIEGKANLGLEKFLKKYFGVRVKIIKGLKSRNKIVEVKN
jgi:uncharacterized protein (TIGR00251 family)